MPLPESLLRIAVPCLLAAACAGSSTKAPIASATAPQSVNALSVVTLDASQSAEFGGNALTYDWSLVTVPAGSKATLSNPHAARPTFTADVAGLYVAQLIVADGAVTSAPVTVQIHVSNCGAGLPTVASVSASPAAVSPGEHVQLSAAGVHDPDNDEGCALNKKLAYAWTLTAPAGSHAALDNAASVTPSFTADIAGVYGASLVVSDPAGNKTTAVTTSVRVANPGVGRSTLTISKQTAVADGQDKVALQMHVVDSAGFALVGVPVHVSTAGTPVTLSAASTTTNATGDASIDAVAKVTGVATFTVDVAAGTAGAFIFSNHPAATFIAGKVTALSFAQQPANGAPGVALGNVVVVAKDQYGNVAPGVPVTLAIGQNRGRPAAGTLSGTLTVNTDVRGTATFAGLQIDNPAGLPDSNGYTLTASTAGAPSVESTAFAVVPAAPAAPEALTVTGGVGVVNVSFAAVADPWLKSYLIANGAGATVATLDAKTTKAQLEAAGPDTYTVQAVDVIGQTSGLGTPVKGKPVPAVPALVVTTVNSTENAVTLTWSQVSDCCLAKYNVYGDTLLVGSTTDTTFTVTNVRPGNASFTVTAVDQYGGESPLSNAVAATINAPAIQSFTVAKTTITSGTAASFTATFSDGTAILNPGNIPVTSGTPVSTGALTADTTFTLTVSDALGTTASSDVAIAVVPAATITSFAAPWPIISAGTATSVTPVFANGTGSVDQGIGPVTSGTAFNTGVLSANTTYTLTVTDAAGTPVSQTLTVHTSPNPNVIGTQTNPAATCRQALDYDSSYGSGVYWLDGDQTGKPQQTWCEMSLDGGGYQTIFAGLNGQANWFDSFVDNPYDCSDPQKHCEERLPLAISRGGDLVVSCGGNSLKAGFAGNAFDTVQQGIDQGNWFDVGHALNNPAPTALTPNADPAQWQALWLGGAGFIAGRPQHDLGVAFASSFNGDNTWDACNGQPDATSATQLLYREPSVATLDVIGAPMVAGQPGAFIVSALDANGQVVRSYRGTVRFTFDNKAYSVPDYTFTAADGGVHRFPLTLTGATNLSLADTYKTSVSGSAAFATGPAIGTQAAPAKSCLQVLLSGSSTGDGMYTLMPDGVSASFQAYCDMTWNGGGWTLTLSTRNGEGPVSAQAGVVDPASGVTQAMPLDVFTALAQAARETHLRTAGNPAGESITSYPLTSAIQNLRARLGVVSIFNDISVSDWYGPYADAYHLDSTCGQAGNTQGPFPNLFQACGTDGIHLLDMHSRWTWQWGNTGANLPMEFYIR